MAVRPIRIYRDPVLRQQAAEVAAVNEVVRRLIEDLRDTMHAYRGVGLAANQIGALERVLVVDVPVEGERRVELTLVNPVLSEPAETNVDEEGCLSIPGIYEEVRRAARVRVKALDERGVPVDMVVQGYLARAIQHEVDHLNGVLFVDRLSVLKRQFLKKSLEALARGERPEGYEPPVAEESSP